MELFYTGWRIVQQFLAADAKLPAPVALPSPADRQVAKELEMRRDFPVVEVVAALEAQSQMDLLEPIEKQVSSSTERDAANVLNDLLVAPVSSIKRNA